MYSQENTAPIADAGSTQTVNPGENVTLNGSNSTVPDNSNIHYYWHQTAGQNVTLSAIRVANPSFIAPNVTNSTILKFELIVDNGTFMSKPSFVEVRVNSTLQPASTSPQSQQKLLGILFIVGLILLAWKFSGGKKPKVRRPFPESVKQQTKRDQNYKCAICKKGTGVWDYSPCLIVAHRLISIQMKTSPRVLTP